MRSYTPILWFASLAFAESPQHAVRGGWIQRQAKLSNNETAYVFLRYDTQLPNKEAIDTSSWAYWNDTEFPVGRCGNSTFQPTGKSDANVSACASLRVIMDDQPGYFSIENWVKSDGNGYGALVDTEGCVFGVSTMQLGPSNSNIIGTDSKKMARDLQSSQTDSVFCCLGVVWCELFGVLMRMYREEDIQVFPGGFACTYASRLSSRRIIHLNITYRF
ncbi:hypothetical protein F4779DRAFT_580559, partial [Xylariaceae sp. FL0662B]